MAKKSRIPAKLQIPLIAVLGLFLIALIIFYVIPSMRDEDDTAVPVATPGSPTPAASSVSVATPEVSGAATVAEVKGLLAEIRSEPAPLIARSEILPPLAGDPFFWALESIPLMAEGDEPRAEETIGENDETMPEEDEILLSRAELLDLLRPSAIATMGGQAVAVVNERFVKRGDIVAGFLVEDIQARQIVLSDHLGTEVVPMSMEYLNPPTAPPPPLVEPAPEVTVTEPSQTDGDETSNETVSADDSDRADTGAPAETVQDKDKPAASESEFAEKETKS